MLKTLCAVMTVLVGLVVGLAGCQMNSRPSIPGIEANAGASALRNHPVSQALAQLFPDPNAKPPKGFESGKIRREDYLTLVEANVDFYKSHQNALGAIIDPVQNKEIQYSTPAFALAAATLVADKKREDLLDPAIRAMSFAAHALANHTTADFHADFYIPMLMHTRRILEGRVPKETLATWDDELRSIVPEKTYHFVHAENNWNIVQIDGEMLRRHAGLVATTQISAQASYVEMCLDLQRKNFTDFGMYTDPNMPMAYDAFPRMWMEDMMADGAYDGPQAREVNEFLRLGGLSTLMLLSPTGEWATGGRSANHQWNER